MPDIKEVLAKYKKDPNRCPWCETEILDFQALPFHKSNIEISQYIICFSCGHQWKNVYKLDRTKFKQD